MAKKKKGLIIVNTGKGKGKSTAAFGVVLRAWGRGLQICVIQFIKSEKGKWGEVKAAQKLGIDWLSTGDGFTWRSKDMDETIARAQYGWKMAQEKITSGKYDLVVLDEFTYLLDFEWLDVNEAISWLEENKPPMQHIIITGRNAPQELIGYADLVTEMKEIKHPYKEQEISAQPGIEF
ncbi:MAG: cob(I)yrinic acid a,c-diamide adenosyltransferase [Anaerolineae bacterium]|jgi:cob(I)alamin adenosyltransferase|nr:cob(I)yrinic acid a,c-diamide adenosyltransferase [Anaerolineae bacterium]MBT3712186.1 cob(I)yrinic acid a,c-diamide adenosyltransferase [Anaerolineae bacterium]MBT4312348.1 cob(I)yrinic acid a,c-diamide adenosyltransferase [Anaerolineae bacterium]MBT4457338.1 cob(I)yrinic acid a,c-diamide adenosyltransferase [Anaerolineae bacterium]MBT4842881.1 cob(I)yrinic acid a,c-diamide adenosyltransferase [Anaerolineae bacterium]